MTFEPVPDSYDLEEDIDPREWRESLEDAFLSFYREEVPRNYAGKAERAEEVFEARPGSPEEWPIEPRGRTQEYLADREIDAGTLYDATVEDLADVLYGQVQARAMDEDDVFSFRDRIQRFDVAFDRLDADFYADIGDHAYTVRRADGREEVFELGREFGTCIGFDVSYEMFEGSEVGAMLANSIEDPHTMYMIVERDGEPAGFSRNLLLEDETGQRWLAIDTMELDRDEYEDERDALKPLALASIQAGLDLGADAVGVSAREGSAKEVIEGYGGLSWEIAYEKVGEPVEMVSHLDGEAGERTLHPLVEDFEGF